jgi:hypothetical protein
MPSLLTVTIALASTTTVEAAVRQWLQLLPRLDDNNSASAPPRIHDPLGKTGIVAAASRGMLEKSILASESYVDDIM